MNTNVLMPSAPPTPVRSRLLGLCKKALLHARAHILWRRLHPRGGTIILIYHSVPGSGERQWIDPTNTTAAGVFAAQMRFLARSRRVVSMSDLVAALEQRRRLEPGTVVLTFDDGYRDNYTVAAPILAELGLPATFFLATGYIGNRFPHWIDHLYSLYRARSAARLDLGAMGSRAFDLHDQLDVDASYAFLSEQLLDADMEQRERLFALLERELLPSASPPRLTLEWHEVHALRAMHPGFHIGVHTREHLALPSRSDERIALELTRCIEDVRDRIGVNPRFFSFPYGRSCRMSRRQTAARFRAAVVTEPPALVDDGTDRFAMPRVSAPDDPDLFRLYTSGAYPDLTRLLLRRA